MGLIAMRNKRYTVAARDPANGHRPRPTVATLALAPAAPPTPPALRLHPRPFS